MAKAETFVLALIWPTFLRCLQRQAALPVLGDSARLSAGTSDSCKMPLQLLSSAGGLWLQQSMVRLLLCCEYKPKTLTLSSEAVCTSPCILVPAACLSCIWTSELALQALVWVLALILLWLVTYA